jgi:hypothetical protein
MTLSYQTFTWDELKDAESYLQSLVVRAQKSLLTPSQVVQNELMAVKRQLNHLAKKFEEERAEREEEVLCLDVVKYVTEQRNKRIIIN